MKRLILSFSIVSLCIMLKVTFAQSSGDYRSKTSGNWNVSTTWETFSGGNWINAVSSPTSANGVITIQAGHNVAGNASVTVDQVVINSGGTLTISGTNTIFTIANGNGIDLKNHGTLVFSSGTINGSSFITLESSSNLNWTGGTLGGSDTLKIKSGATCTVSSSNHYIADSRVISNSGTFNWSSGAILFKAVDPSIVNSGNFNINTDDDFGLSTSNTGTLINKVNGTITKATTSGETKIDGFASFYNEGLIKVTSGTLNIKINSIHSGTLNISSGAKAKFPEGTCNFNANNSCIGSGSLSIEGATVNFNSSSSVSTTTINLSSGVLSVDSSLSINSGITLNFSGGILNGTGEVIFKSGSTLNWTGGTMGGTGTTTIKSGAALSLSSNSHYLSDSRYLSNYGILTWTAGNLYYSSSAPEVDNFGTFNIYTDADVVKNTTNSGLFTNKSGGIINKIGSPTDSTSIDGFSLFTNEGVINVISGKLNLNLSSTQAGTVNISFGAAMKFLNGTANFNTGNSISGAGSLEIEGGNVNLNASSTFSIITFNLKGGSLSTFTTIAINSGTYFNFSKGTLNGTGVIEINSGSTFNWTGGTLAGSVTTNINSDANMLMSTGNHTIGDTHLLNNYGTWSWNSGNLIYNSSTPVINNYAILNINTDADIVQAITNSGLFVNKVNGIMNKYGSATSETIFSGFGSFMNEGTINVNSGNIHLSISSTHTGSTILNFGTRMKFLSGTINFNSGSSLTGSGTVSFEGATISFNSLSTISAKTINLNSGTLTMNYTTSFASGVVFNFNDGTLNGSDSINFNSGSTFNWFGGTMSGNGITTVKAGATLLMNNSGRSFKDTRILNSYGSWTWSGGKINFKSSTPVINNYGTLDINTDADFSNSGTTTGIFTNKPSGIINKTGSTDNETSFDGFGSFNNDGTINVLTGNLALNVIGTHSGTYNISPSCQLRGSITMIFTGLALMNSGAITLTGLSFQGSSFQTLNGNGTVNALIINNATGVALGGTQTVNNSLTLTSGKISIGNNNLVMASSGIITGGNGTNYIITNGTGSLQLRVSNNNIKVSFPIGHSASYMPISIKLNASSVADDFKARVLPNLFGIFDENGNSAGSPVSGNIVNGSWIVSEVVAGGSTATLTYQWNVGDEISGFSRSLSQLAQFKNGAWSLSSAAAATGSGPYIFTQSGLTTFSPFGIINQFVSCYSSYLASCINTTLSVPVVAVGNFNSGNNFKAQLSDASGNFGAPVNIGTLNSTTSGIINATIPGTTPAGSGYRIRVKTSDPAFQSGDNGSNISIGINTTYYLDADNDSYGNPLSAISNCSQPIGYVIDNTDCNDVNINIHPGKSESCNAIDDDCNSQIDEGVKIILYVDIDNDGYGNYNNTILGCPSTPGYVLNSTDCNDDEITIHPNATETCNYLDDNCNGQMDENAGMKYFEDYDEDLYGNPLVSYFGCSMPSWAVADSTDCDDFDPGVHPGSTEICNGIDDDCDGNSDTNTITATITPSGTVTICSGNSILLTANSGPDLSYQWLKNNNIQAGATNSTYSVSKSGDYQVSESNSSGCASISLPTTVIVAENPQAVITPLGDLDICLTGSVTLEANSGTGLSYLWKKGNNTVGTSQTYNATSKGTYKLTVTNMEGCSKTSKGTKVTKSCKESNLKLEEIILQEIKVTPNPNTGIFELVLLLDELKAEANIQVVNVIGQCIYNQRALLINGELKTQISLKDSTIPGMYILKVLVNNKVYTSRIILQKY